MDNPYQYATAKPLPRFQKKGIVEVGKTYRCNVEHPWKAPIRGVCEQIYNHSAKVRITSTSNDNDEWLARERNDITVVPLKRMIPGD